MDTLCCNAMEVAVLVSPQTTYIHISASSFGVISGIFLGKENMLIPAVSPFVLAVVTLNLIKSE